MAIFEINDPLDPRLEPYRLVQDRDRAGGGARPGLFVGETPVVVQAMLEMPGRTRSILASAHHRARVEAMLAEAVAKWPARRVGAEPESAREAKSAREPETALEIEPALEPDVYVVPESIVEPLTGFNVHRGLLAIGVRPAPKSVRELVGAHAGAAHATSHSVAHAGASALATTTRSALTLLCVEGVNNMDNIGQLFRIAAAMACDGVVLSTDCHDPLYRKSLRVSCGCALRVPFARSIDWHGDLRFLRDELGVAVVGATGGGDATIDQIARTKPARVAVVVGAEFAGLSAETLALCTHRVRIPMAIGVDSLNVGIAAAVLLDRLSQGERR